MASIFDSPGAINAILAAQSQGLFADVNPTGVAPMQRSGSGILETSEYTGDPELPGATWMDVVANINDRYMDRDNRIQNSLASGAGENFLGSNMVYSPEMTERLGLDSNKVEFAPKPEYGYTVGQAKEDVVAELNRNGIYSADDLKQSVPGSHNDLYPNLGWAGNKIYDDKATGFEPHGGSSRDVNIDPFTEANAPIGSYVLSETGETGGFGPGLDIIAGILAPVTGGLSVVAAQGLKAGVGGQTLHKDDYVKAATSVILNNVDTLASAAGIEGVGGTNPPSLPPTEVDPTIYNLVAGGGELGKQAETLDNIIAGGMFVKKGYDILDEIRDYEKELAKETEIGQVGDITGPGGAYDITVLDYPNAPELPPESTEGGGGGGSTSATTEQGGASAPSEGGLEPIGEIPDPVVQPTHDWPDASYEFETDDAYDVTPTVGGNVLIITHKDTGATRRVGASGRDMRDSADEVVEEEEEPFIPPTTNLPDGYRWEEGEDGEPVLVNESEEEDDFDLSVEGSMEESGLSLGGLIGDLADMQIEDMTPEQIAQMNGTSGSGTTGDGVNGDGDNGTGEGDGGDGDGDGDGTLSELSGQTQESQLKELDDLFPYLSLTPSEYAKLRDNPDLVAALLGDRA